MTLGYIITDYDPGQNEQCLINCYPTNNEYIVPVTQREQIRYEVILYGNDDYTCSSSSLSYDDPIGISIRIRFIFNTETTWRIEFQATPTILTSSSTSYDILYENGNNKKSFNNVSSTLSSAYVCSFNNAPNNINIYIRDSDPNAPDFDDITCPNY